MKDRRIRYRLLVVIDLDVKLDDSVEDVFDAVQEEVEAISFNLVKGFERATSRDVEDFMPCIEKIHTGPLDPIVIDTTNA